MIEESYEDFEMDDDELETSSTPLYERHRIVVDKGQTALRIDRFLCDRIENTSRSRLQKSAEAGYIKVNGIAVKSNYKIKPMDVITLYMDTPALDLEIYPQDIPLDIVYEDECLMVVNKPAGLVVHPGHGNFDGTLVNAIAWHMKDQADFDPNDPSVGLVHRIDKDTSGLLLIAKTAEAKSKLARQFFEKTTKREYKALVWGNLEADEGTIEGNIARNPKDRLQMKVFSDPEIGKTAVTHYKVLERFEYVTLVECRLETGRTHQIRVHMKHIGYPLFNDGRYGGDQVLRGEPFAKYRQFVANCFKLCPRQALHAASLGFIHPITNEEIYLTSELPEDMGQLVEKWSNYISNKNI